MKPRAFKPIRVTRLFPHKHLLVTGYFYCTPNTVYEINADEFVTAINIPGVYQQLEETHFSDIQLNRQFLTILLI